MEKRDIQLLILILFLAGLAIYVDLNIEHPVWFENLQFWRPAEARDIAVRYGLDLRGGLKVLLAADIPDGEVLDSASMETARRVVENRVNGMGLTEPVVQAQGDRRIIVELPGIDDPELAVQMIRGTALLEFVDTYGAWLPPGTVVQTSEAGAEAVGGTDVVTDTSGPDVVPVIPPGLPVPGPQGTEPISPTSVVTDSTTGDVVYPAIITGAGLEQVGLDLGQQNQYEVQFRLYPDAAAVFAAFTAQHAPAEGGAGYYPLCIVLDKVVLSCPVIESYISNGQAVIRLGDASYEEARTIAIQLRYGALPVPLRVETISTVGPTLGEISVERSVRAGIVGLAVVLLFMLVYYRLPGGLADIALLIYAALNLALYKLVPITLTLPGIAGFLLSAGMAVDANILVFERMKEELRAGRSLKSAIEVGFGRAWTSIRDSQVSTVIVCLILGFFGRTFGASMVQGFAWTLLIGTIINMFTAVVATRTFIRLAFRLAGDWLRSRRWLLGV